MAAGSAFPALEPLSQDDRAALDGGLGVPVADVLEGNSSSSRDRGRMVKNRLYNPIRNNVIPRIGIIYFF